MTSQRRDWVFLAETSGDRDPLLARVQIEVLRHLLTYAEPDDKFTVLAANTRVKPLSKELLLRMPGVRGTRSSFIMQAVKSELAWAPIPQAASRARR